MANFYASKDWTITLPPNAPETKKAAEDLSLYIGLLAGLTDGLAEKQPPVLEAGKPLPPGGDHIIALTCENGSPQQNGFRWKAGPQRIEICGESGRGLCNGIYSFLGALGISWPAPGQAILPSPQVTNLRVFALSAATSPGSLADGSVSEPSGCAEGSPAAASWRRLIPAGKNDAAWTLKNGENFIAWAARRRYDAVILPLAQFSRRRSARRLAELSRLAAGYGIALEAGGHELSLLMPRRHFLLRRDMFRMEGGRRRLDHNFCPTNPQTMRIIAQEGEKLFRAAEGSATFHLWPEKGGESAWCACPTCRAFTPAEQNRIAANAAAAALAAANPAASLTFCEKPGESANVPLRSNLFRMEKMPEEKEFR
ncbi:MAG: DUF4838 domain-containing protein [Treponema sp.]|nr:DUF4838 domain-containing protein [Treponema sp.]